ncbi:MAG: hypothetical protein QOK27_1628, partial [Gemmatimonadales bacterium]|nr:hypothetical protein [Gemmatimonadales bacterium]
ALTFPGLISAQVPTRSGEPLLVVPTTATPVPSQPTVVPAPVAPAAAQAETTVTAVTAAPGTVTTVPVPTQTTSSTAQAATADMRSYTAASKFYLELGLASGTAGTYVHRVEGGDPIADVNEKPDGGGLIYRQVTNVKRTDIVAEVRPNDFTDLIRDFLQEQYTRVDGRLVGIDYTLKPASQLGFSHAMLTGVDLPALDASSLETGYLTIHLSPEAAQDQQPGSAPAGTTTTMGAKQQQLLIKNFSLTVSGLDSKRVTRIEPLSISMNYVPDQLGTVRQTTTQPGKLGWGFLTVTFGAADAPSWMAWRDDFLIKGNNTDAAEKSLVLTLLAPDLTTRLFELNGSGVGLVTLRRLPATSADAAPKYQAQLYVEQWSVGKGTSKGS